MAAAELSFSLSSYKHPTTFLCFKTSLHTSSHLLWHWRQRTWHISLFLAFLTYPFLPLFNVSVDHGHIHLWGKITSDGHPTFLLFKPFLPGHLLIASLPTCQLKSAPINTSFSPVEPRATSSTFFCEKVYFFCNCCSTWHQLVLLTLHTNTQQKIPTNFYLLFLMTSYSSLPSPVIFFLHLNWCLWPRHFIWSFFTT